MKKISWHNTRFRAWVYQGMILFFLIAALFLLWNNLQHNLNTRHIQTGFAFLHQEAGFAIGESFIAYDLTDTYWQALKVGLLNTLFVSLVGMVLATLLGTLVGIARLSPHYLLSRLALIYIELMRNIPLVIHLFFWYAVLTEILPPPRQALEPITGFFLSNRGIKVPSIEGKAWLGVLIALGMALLLSILLKRYANYRQAKTGKTIALLPFMGLIWLGLPLVAYWIQGERFQVAIPELRGFNFVNGWHLSPELCALLLGLVLYTAGFVAEIVRSGIQSVPKGQWEAGSALGLSRQKTLRLIILPQAFRVMIPAMSNTLMNFTKNSSLAVAIGYPDLVSIVNTMLSQTGQAIEAVLIIMGAYFTISMIIAVLMAWYNKRVALVER